MDRYSTNQQRWKALVERDERADGAYVYGVVTTGIYCRPACASKLPNRENVQFFDTWEEAEQAGFRPCKRCSPSSPDGQVLHHEAIVRACRLIEESENSPSLADLANAVGFSPSYFHRLFKREVGLTPKQYATAVRSNRVRAGLQTSSNVTEAIHEAGYASSSRFYDRTTTTLGMEPSQYRNGGQGQHIRFAVSPCYLGWVLVAATEKGICAIELGGDPKEMEESLRARFPQAEFTDSDPAFMDWVTRVLAFLETPRDHIGLPLDIRGTAFQQRVWLTLQQIPPGSTATYADIAARLNSPKAARAVAAACAANSIAVAIPCHRVVRSDGSLGGYRWGSERKQRLLEREADELDG